MKLFTTLIIGLIAHGAVAAGISINADSVTGLPDPIEDSDAATKVYVDNAAAPEGIEIGDMQYWDGAAWVLIPPPPVNGRYQMVFEDGVPQWSGPYFFVGDVGPAGGIVFYVAPNGLDGLEVAPSAGAGATWGCEGVELAGADGTALGTGAQNSQDILAGCSEPGIAARFADNYTINGFDDWFVPSKDELDLLYQLRDLIGGFDSINYWSSSEYDANQAWRQAFSTGFQSPLAKSNFYRTRPIRQFDYSP